MNIGTEKCGDTVSTIEHLDTTNGHGRTVSFESVFTHQCELKAGHEGAHRCWVFCCSHGWRNE